METVISHYVRIDVKVDQRLEVFLTEETFDLGDYLRAQVKWAVDCPYNRNAVRVKMGWSDEQLQQSPRSSSLLINNFIDEHGDDWFRTNLRPKFIKVKLTRLEILNLGCLLVEAKDRCGKCELCQVIKLITK